MLDIFQGLGALAGVASFIFVIWEKWFRFYPSAFLVAHPLIEGGAAKSPFLRVQNRSDRPIILTWADGPSRTAFRIGKDQTTRALVRSLVATETSTPVEGLAVRVFPVYRPEGFDDLDAEAVIELEFLWRFAQPMIYKRDRRVRMQIDKRSVLTLTDSEDGDLL
ncbi:hypothetical protein [Rhizobium sp. Root1203]|uniref:hypothetical protein n=1 Tax=Rhizobium sp. Root1203 TaxID=1736427 RepID=UPI000AD1B72E|nr:hypothetical protein [Rhizobium sp. Root1203]